MTDDEGTDGRTGQGAIFFVAPLVERVVESETEFLSDRNKCSEDCI